jgi:hypothetical protein
MRHIPAVFLLMLVSLKIMAGETRYCETEDFDLLPHYGNWADVDGWYVKRHSHASGGAFTLTHTPNAKMCKTLAKPLPAGKYNLYLRLVMNTSFRTINELQISVGNKDDKGELVPLASSKFRHDFVGSGYGWYLAGAEMSIKDAADCLEIAALQVENMGIGDDPESQKPYAIIDALLITDEKIELLPGKRGRNELKFLTGEDPRGETGKIPYPVLSAEVQLEQLPSERALTSSKNLLRNSSFECSLKPHFAAWNSSLSGVNVDADCLCTDNPFHGKYCLALRSKVLNLLDDYEGSDKQIKYGGAMSLYAFERFRKEELATLAKDIPLVISCYLRTNGKELKFRLGENSFTASHQDWQRYHGRYVPRDKNNVFEFTAADPDAVAFLDALQIEQGQEPTEYGPLSGLEIGIQTLNRSNIYYCGEETPLEISASQTGAKAGEITLHYKLLNIFLETVLAGDKKIKLGTEGAESVPFHLPFAKRGSYLLMYTVDGYSDQAYAVPLYYVDNPKTIERNRMLGAIISTNEETMKIFSHAGFDWVDTLNDRTLYYSNLWPNPDTLRLYHKYWRMWQDKYDIEYTVSIVPFANVPKWDTGTYGVEAAAHMGRKNITYANWIRLWDTLPRHLDYVKSFIPVDELSYHRGPHDALPYVWIAEELIHRHRPDAKVMISSQGIGIRDMLAINPGMKMGNAIGGSRHGFERNLYYYDRNIIDRTGKEFWVIGVGWGGDSWYQPFNFETFGRDEKIWREKFTQTMENVNTSIFQEAAIVGVNRFCFYVAKFDNGSDPCSMFNGDNTVEPFGIRYINAVNFLREHESGGAIHLDKAEGVSAAWFKRKGKTNIFIAPTGAYEHVNITLGIPAGKFTLYDFDFNRIPSTSTLKLSLGKTFVIEDNGIGEEGLIAAVKQMQAFPANMEKRLLLAEEDGIKLCRSIIEKNKPTLAEKLPVPSEAGFKYPFDLVKNTPTFCWGVAAAKVAASAINLDGEPKEPSWGNVASSYVYCWPVLDGSYGALQGIAGFDDVFSLSDVSASFKTLWDGENIYLSINLLDDQAAPADRVFLRIDADLIGDLDSTEMNEDDFSLSISTGGKTGLCEVDFTYANGKTVDGAVAFLKRGDAGASVEVKIPLTALGVRAGKCHTMGFNLEILDQDSETISTVLSWVGNYAPRNSPRGFGQLLLMPEK